MTDVRCAEVSAAAGEPLAGTAATVQSWLLVEVRGAWPRDVASAVSDEGPASTAIRRWLEDVPSSRLLFIRKPGRAHARKVAFVVRAAETEPEIRRIELGELDDVGAVDLACDGEVVDASLLLVCGHGTRDACCALRGSAVYGAFAPYVPPEELWISSHQGGHRFAANVLVLPAGIQLGRVTPEEAGRVVDDLRAGRIPLARYRGTTSYSSRVQAAEVAVREATGLAGWEDVTLLVDDGKHVRLATGDGRSFAVVVDEVAGLAVPASCGGTPEPQPAFRARLV